MPIIRYTLNCGEGSFSELGTFEPTDDPTALVNEIILKPLNARRLELEEPELVLEKVEVINHYVHLHTWRKSFVDRTNLRANYICDRCGITGYKPFNIFKGDDGRLLLRDYEFKKEKFELCRDPLKPMPKKLIF